MDRFWLAPRSSYSRTMLLPAGKNYTKPDKLIGSDGKLAEDSFEFVSTEDIVDNIINGLPVLTIPKPYFRKPFFPCSSPFHATWTDQCQKPYHVH